MVAAVSSSREAPPFRLRSLTSRACLLPGRRTIAQPASRSECSSPAFCSSGSAGAAALPGLTWMAVSPASVIRTPTNRPPFCAPGLLLPFGRKLFSEAPLQKPGERPADARGLPLERLGRRKKAPVVPLGRGRKKYQLNIAELGHVSGLQSGERYRAASHHPQPRRSAGQGDSGREARLRFTGTAML